MRILRYLKWVLWEQAWEGLKLDYRAFKKAKGIHG